MQDVYSLLSVAADWIDKVNHENACLPNFPDFPGSQQKQNTPEDFVRCVRHTISTATHPSYVEVYRAINGWQTMLKVWCDDDQDFGFYDVEQTGFGPYGHLKEGYQQARDEAESWAKDIGVETKIPEFEKLPEDEPKNITEWAKSAKVKVV